MRSIKLFCMIIAVVAVLSACSNDSASVLPSGDFISTPVDMSRPSEGGNEITSGGEQDDTVILENSVVTGNPVNLPEPESVSPLTNPYMYDFLYGCLGWHTDVRHEAWGTTTYIMRHKSAPYILFVDNYEIQDEPVMPPRGQKIERHELNATELGIFNAAVAKSDDKFIIEEGDWEFIVYNPSMFNLGIRLWDATDYTEGNTPTFLADKTGWPSDYLRKEPYASRLLDRNGVDIRDEWWDVFRYKGVYNMLPTNVDYGVYYLVCVGVDAFEFHAEGIAASGEIVSWAVAVERMIEMGYYLPGYYEDGESVYDIG